MIEEGRQWVEIMADDPDYQDIDLDDVRNALRDTLDGEYQGRNYKLMQSEFMQPPCCNMIAHTSCLRKWIDEMQFSAGGTAMMDGKMIAANKKCPCCRRPLV